MNQRDIRDILLENSRELLESGFAGKFLSEEDFVEVSQVLYARIDHYPEDICFHSRQGRVRTVHLDNVKDESLKVAAEIAVTYAQNVMYKGKAISKGCFEEDQQ